MVVVNQMWIEIECGKWKGSEGGDMNGLRVGEGGSVPERVEGGCRPQQDWRTRMLSATIENNAECKHTTLT